MESFFDSPQLSVSRKSKSSAQQGTFTTRFFRVRGNLHVWQLRVIYPYP